MILLCNGIKVASRIGWHSLCNFSENLSQLISAAFNGFSQILWTVLNFPVQIIYHCFVHLFSSKWATLGVGACLVAIAVQFDTSVAYISNIYDMVQSQFSVVIMACLQLVEVMIENDAVKDWAKHCAELMSFILRAMWNNINEFLSFIANNISVVVDPIKAPWAVFESAVFMGVLESILLTIHLLWDRWCGLDIYLPWVSREPVSSTCRLRERFNWVMLMRVRSKLFVLPFLSLRFIFVSASAVKSILLYTFGFSSVISIVSLMTNHPLLLYMLSSGYFLFIGLQHLTAELFNLRHGYNAHDRFINARQGQSGEEIRRTESPTGNGSPGK